MTDQPVQKSFGSELRRIRREAGRSMGDVARHLGLSVPYISDVEQGRRGPFGPEYLRKIAVFFGKDGDYLSDLARLHRNSINLNLPDNTELRSLGLAFARMWPEFTPEEIAALKQVCARSTADDS